MAIREARLEKEWLQYAMDVLPRDAGAAQVRGTYLAFMAGARKTLEILHGAVDPDPDKEPTTVEISVLEDIHAEIDDLTNRLQRLGDSWSGFRVPLPWRS
jgi:hypothetical protein